MRTVLKWIGRILGGLVGLIVIAMVAVYIISSARMNKSYAIAQDDIPVSDDPEAIARGKHLVTSIADCTGCHGPNLSGEVMVDDVAFGRLTSSNLTAGQGGVGSIYSDADYIHAIRHGVRPDGSALLFMPSHEFNKLSGEDVAAIVAYVRTVPPVDNTPEEDRIGPLARLLYVMGQLPLVPAELVDHDAPPIMAVQAGETAAYGEYLAVVCSGCHGEELNGGPITGAPPDAPPAANLTQLGEWQEEDFFRVLREGVGPDGLPVSDFMPWKAFGNMEDSEIRAIWLYLQTLEPQPMGG